MNFDPFENRLCRDVRNTIGHAFVHAIHKKHIHPFISAVNDVESQKTSLDIGAYIQNRQTCLEKMLKTMETWHADQDFFIKITKILWNNELFFELHEWLEEKWTTSRGKQKKRIQALILTAIAYEQLTYNRLTPAKKVAAKALSLIEQYQTPLPDLFEPEVLINILTTLDRDIPRL